MAHAAVPQDTTRRTTVTVGFVPLLGQTQSWLLGAHVTTIIMVTLASALTQLMTVPVYNVPQLRLGTMPPNSKRTIKIGGSL